MVQETFALSSSQCQTLGEELHCRLSVEDKVRTSIISNTMRVQSALILGLVTQTAFAFTTTSSPTTDVRRVSANQNKCSSVVVQSATGTSPTEKEPTVSSDSTPSDPFAFVQRLFQGFSPSQSSKEQEPSVDYTAQIAELETTIDTAIQTGSDPRPLIQQLEAIPSLDEPNRSPEFLGEWNVFYTDCPPPSNGKLGPFQGTASQVILDESTRSFKNVLRVPPNDWLTAVLDGVYEDWDGVTLDEEAAPQSLPLSEADWGARHWKVTFLQLQISCLGFPLFTKEFGPNTSRVWRTTYLRDDIRIVRAGKTGRLKDEVVFYTKRSATPKGWKPN